MIEEELEVEKNNHFMAFVFEQMRQENGEGRFANFFFRKRRERQRKQNKKKNKRDKQQKGMKETTNQKKTSK